MPRELVLPELAESVVEGEIVKWLVAEGETVAQDQPVVEVMTDKVTVELPSPFAGTLEKHLVAEGAVVAVHDPIALFSDDATGTQEAGATAEEAPKLEVAEAPTADAPPVTPTGREPSVQAREERSIVEPSSGVGEDDGDALSLFKADKDDPGAPVYQVRRGAAPQAAKATGPYGRPLAVPAARKLARELGLELTAVAGSGPHGRIRVEDVRRAAEASASNP